MSENIFKIILTGNGFDMFLDEEFNKIKKSKFSKNIEKEFIKNLNKLKEESYIALFFWDLFPNIYLYQKVKNYNKEVIDNIIIEFIKFEKEDSLENSFKVFFKNKDYSVAKNLFSDLYLVTIFLEWNKIAKRFDNQLIPKLKDFYLSEEIIKNKPDFFITTNFTYGTLTFKQIIIELLIKQKKYEKISYEEIHNFSFSGYSRPQISINENLQSEKISFIMYPLQMLSYHFKNPQVNMKEKDVKNTLDKVFNYLVKNNTKKICFETFGHATYNDKHIFEYLILKKKLLEKRVQLEVICNYYSLDEEEKFKNSKWEYLKIKTQSYKKSWIYKVIKEFVCLIEN